MGYFAATFIKIMLNNLRKYYSIIFVILVVITAASLLSFTYNFTKPRLALQQDETTLELLQKLFPATVFYCFDEDTEIYTVYDDNEDHIGYAFYAEGLGYGGKMVILVGLKNKDVIEGITIISHHEQLVFTLEIPMELDFTLLVEQLTDLKISDCYLRDKNSDIDGKIDSITGATISSKAVVDTVRESVVEKIAFIN